MLKNPVFLCRVNCRSHTYVKYLAKRVEGIPFLLNLLAYSEIIGFEKTKEN